MRTCVKLLATALLLVYGNIPASAVTIGDGNFNSGDWSLTVFTRHIPPPGAGGTVTAVRQPTGGNPDAYREVTDSVAQGNSLVLGISIYTPLQYDPAVSGPLSPFNMSIDYHCPGCPGDGQAFGAAILQGGNYYLSFKGNVTQGTASWMTAAQSFSETDFILYDDVTSYPALHPDFSATGAKMFFGFVTGNSTFDFGYVVTAGYDNFQTNVQATAVVPVPATLPLFATGFAGLGWLARRRRKHAV
jgi:hypothetical protein